MIAPLHAVGVCVNALPKSVNAAKPERFSSKDQEIAIGGAQAAKLESNRRRPAPRDQSRRPWRQSLRESLAASDRRRKSRGRFHRVAGSQTPAAPGPPWPPGLPEERGEVLSI